MPLYKIIDFDLDYRNHFDNEDIQGFDFYVGDEKIGNEDNNADRVYVDGFSRAQVESLPEYNENMPVDYAHAEQMRGVYRPMASTSGASAAQVV